MKESKETLELSPLMNTRTHELQAIAASEKKSRPEVLQDDKVGPGSDCQA